MSRVSGISWVGFDVNRFAALVDLGTRRYINLQIAKSQTSQLL